jgi:nitrite reductase/ring-hydroxylating ferredoxin subunit
VSTESFVSVARASDVNPGRRLAVTVDDREIVLFNVDGTVYALENACPHQGAPLYDGWVQGTTVTCTWHAWCFNLTDGLMTHGGRVGVDAFDVRIENDHVWVSRTPRPKPTR